MTFSWLGRVFNIPTANCSWEEFPTQADWGDTADNLWRTLISDLVHSAPDFGSYMKTRPADGEYVAVRPGPVFFDYFQGWLRIFRTVQENRRSGRNVDTSSSGYQDTEALCNEWMPQISGTTGKRVGVTRLGRLALLPRDAAVGDEGCVFSGVNVPFLVRRKGEHYRIVGSCYLHGMMDGQTL